MQVYNHNDIKEWYQATYPDDDMGEDIIPNTDWYTLWLALIGEQDIYGIIGVGDSVVRERIFSELADTMGVDYNVVYYTWQGDKTKALISLINK